MFTHRKCRVMEVKVVKRLSLVLENSCRSGSNEYKSGMERWSLTYESKYESSFREYIRRKRKQDDRGSWEGGTDVKGGEKKGGKEGGAGGTKGREAKVRHKEKFGASW